MMESLLHTDRVSVKDRVKLRFKMCFMMQTAAQSLFPSHSVPLWLKMPSISMEDLEWAMQSMAQGTRPS